MDPIRMIARPMLGGIFLATGMSHIKNPDYGAEVAQGFNDQVLEPVGMGVDGPTLMKVHGYVSVVAGAGLALGVAPRLCALALAADVTAVNLTANRFWEQEGEERQGTQIQFLKDLAIAGGLLIASVDTKGKPGLAWRAQHAAELAGNRADHMGTIAGLKKDIVGLQAENKALKAKAAVAGSAGVAGTKLAGSAGKATGKAAGVTGLLGSQAKAGKKLAKAGSKGGLNAFAAKKKKDSLVDRVSDAFDDAVKSAKKTVNA